MRLKGDIPYLTISFLATHFIAKKHLFGAIYSSGYGTELNQSGKELWTKVTTSGCCYTRLRMRYSGRDRKNLVRVSITEKGQQAYDKSTRRKPIYKIISSLSEEERQQLRSCLEKLRNKAFKELIVEYKPPPLPQFQ